MAHITGNSSNVHINAADLVLTGTEKKLIAPKAELTNISGVSLITTGRVGVSNVSPVHTLDVGANVYVDDTATGSDPVLNVIGRLKATTIDFQTGGTDGGIFFNDGGALNTDTDGLSFNKTTNILTVGGGIVSDGLATLNQGLKVTSGDSLLKNVYANTTVITNGLTVSSGTTDVQALTATTGDFTSAVGIDGDFDIATDKFTVSSVTGNTTIAGTLGVTGVSTLSSASITGAGNALTVSNNAVISGQMRAASGLIDNNLQVNGNLIVDGELTVLTTNNLVIQDPLIELGNTNTNSGAVIDVGMVFRQPSGTSNVVTFYDGSDSKYRIGLTSNSAYDSTITTTGSIEVEVTGNITSTGNVNASDALVTGDLSMGSGNIRISGNTIYFT